MEGTDTAAASFIQAGEVIKDTDEVPTSTAGVRAKAIKAGAVKAGVVKAAAPGFVDSLII
jgi:hypothetical protein